MTTTTRDAFIQQQIIVQASPQPPFTNLGIYHICDTITFRWLLDFPTPVADIDVLIIKLDTHVIQIDYSEFNNLDLLEEFGCHVTGGLCGWK